MILITVALIFAFGSAIARNDFNMSQSDIRDLEFPEADMTDEQMREFLQIQYERIVDHSEHR